MAEPNFSESQLQFEVNMAIMNGRLGRLGLRIFIPTLIEEFMLGWDSGFYFPWLHYGPLVRQHGCNVFIQYKLSDLLTHKTSNEWESWGCEYFRFKIPHHTRDANGKFGDDYHQWNALKILAGQGYPTYYSTNFTIREDELNQAFESDTLLNKTPFLDIRNVASPHKHVTFTPDSDHFKLHSEVMSAKRAKWLEISSELVEGRGMDLGQSNQQLIKALSEIFQDNPLAQKELSSVKELFHVPNDKRAYDIPGELRPIIQFIRLRAFVFRFIGAHLAWLPTM